MKKRDKILLLAVWTITMHGLPGIAFGQHLSNSGQVIGWAGGSYNDQWIGQAGGRYIPELKLNIKASSALNIEGEFSLNMAGSYTSPVAGDKLYGKVKPYRAWMKVSGEQFEIRAGLQKINFGSALTLRPMMWFDRIDPRDPLQLTDGVYAILGRYYFLNNANIWLWALAFNDGTMGWETYKSDKNRPEFGGRVQLPFPIGEFALTYNNRKVDYKYLITDVMKSAPFTENKVGFDMKVDAGVGLWTEGVLKQRSTNLISQWEKYFTFGMDYTFGLGNGLTVTGEYLGFGQSGKIWSNAVSHYSFAGISVNYPISITTGISGIVYWDPQTNNLYRFVNMTLTYDRFSFYFMGFMNPDLLNIFNVDTAPSIFGGKGVQFMMVWNY